MDVNSVSLSFRFGGRGIKEGLILADMQIPVMLGKLDDAKTFEDAGERNCAMVVAADDDIRNVNIAFRARASIRMYHRRVHFSMLGIHLKKFSLAGANHVVKGPQTKWELSFGPKNQLY